MILSCIDPRFQHFVCRYAKDQGLEGEYSHVAIAGAAIGVVALRFETWHATFWENLRISLTLHRIRRVIVINHRRCGAAEEAYGPFELDHAAETRLH